ncbi:MAG: rhodanese-like domain-containing protein [Myxococcales bacterium]|nr:rhodanese-like domain-containing protein [Myxococcales bacterium]
MRTVLLAAALVSLLSAAGCSRSEPTPGAAPTAPSPKKDPATARKMIAEGAAVVDVRTAGEFAEEHLPGAINVPVESIREHLAEVDKLVGGDKAKAVVVYCAAGSRAAKAKGVLEEAGYQRVVNGGGLDDLR